MGTGTVTGSGKGRTVVWMYKFTVFIECLRNSESPDIYNPGKAFPFHLHFQRLEALQERLDVDDVLIERLY